MSDQIAYCTREMVQQELNFSATARLTARVDRAIRSGARQIERTLHRVFYPTLATRSFDVPVGDTLWLYSDELAAAPDSIVSGAVTFTTDDFILHPQSPPHRWIEINTSGRNYWTAGPTSQRAVAITGSYGGSATELPAGTLASAISDSATTIDLQESEMAGVGDLIRIDAERMVVTNRSMISTGVTLTADAAASKSVAVLSVSDPSGLAEGELIQVGAERMFVEAILGDDLVVTRAEGGSGLFAHTAGSEVYAPRRLTVTRAVAGTTAATHAGSAPAYRNFPPPLVTAANVALAIAECQQASAGYSGSSGSGDSKRSTPGDLSVAALERAYDGHGVTSRQRAVM